MPDTEKLYTADDLWNLSHCAEYRDMRLELVNGKLIEMPLNSFQHGIVADELSHFVHNFVHDQRLGCCLAGGTGYQLNRITVLAPDFSFIATERLQGGLPEQYIPFAPDLAIDIVEAWESADLSYQRAAGFLSYGTSLFWVLYLDSHTAEIFVDGDARTIETDQYLDGGDVLPGFSVKLSEIYAALDVL